MNKSKICGSFIALAFMASALVNTVSATTVTGTAFGDFSYDLSVSGYPGTRTADVRVEAYTSITKPSSSSTVYLTLDIRDNSTGALYQTYTDSDSVRASKTFGYNTGLRDLGIFGCHEARGTTSVVRYTSCKV